jgi:hypothetical protein
MVYKILCGNRPKSWLDPSKRERKDITWEGIGGCIRSMINDKQ